MARQAPIDWHAHEHDWVQIALLFEGADCELTWWTPEGKAHCVSLGGKIVWFIPAGVRHASRWRQEAYLLTIYVPPEFFRRWHAEAESEVLIDGPGSLVQHDPVIWALAAMIKFLWDELRGPDVTCIEALAGALVRRLFSAHRHSEAHGGLDRNEVERVNEHVLGHIGGKITVPDLARLVSLSPGHFAEKFFLATGWKPSDYVMQMRLHRAQELIIGGVQLSAVAYATGFSDQSHMTRCFRQHYGITPKMLRLRS